MKIIPSNWSRWVQTPWAPRLLTVGVLFLLWFWPCPEGVDVRAWHLLAIFVATVVGFIAKPYPMPVVAIVAIALCALTGTVSTKESLSAFGNTTIWLIVSAFFLSRAFIKTGLGNRIAYLFMSKLGKTTLGLAYGVTLTNLCLAPVVPSNTARLGGILYPLQLATALAFDSSPAKGTHRKIGSFLMASVFYSNLVVSAMFMTAMAANPLIVGFARDAGAEISWATWAIGACVPGVICLVLVPLLLFVIWPPEIRKSPEAVTIAKAKLAEMGPMSRQEQIMLGVFVLLLLLWTVGAHYKINATNAALVGLGLLLLTNVLTWKDLAAEKGAWSTLMWFSALIMMAKFLSKLGFISWLSQHLSSVVVDVSWEVGFVMLVAIYLYAHYLFASQTAHVAAMYAAFLAVLIAIGTPPMLAALGLAYSSNLMGGLTHYGNGSAPIFLDSGYMPLKVWWPLSFVVSLLFFVAFVIIGPMWWRLVGLV